MDRVIAVRLHRCLAVAVLPCFGEALHGSRTSWQLRQRRAERGLCIAKVAGLQRDFADGFVDGSRILRRLRVAILRCAVDTLASSFIASLYLPSAARI